MQDRLSAERSRSGHGSAAGAPVIRRDHGEDLVALTPPRHAAAVLVTHTGQAPSPRLASHTIGFLLPRAGSPSSDRPSPTRRGRRSRSSTPRRSRQRPRQRGRDRLARVAAPHRRARDAAAAPRDRGAGRASVAPNRPRSTTRTPRRRSSERIRLLATDFVRSSASAAAVRLPESTGRDEGGQSPAFPKQVFHALAECTHDRLEWNR